MRDDGAGIPPDMLDSVFELFVQSKRTLDRAAGGLGVGLTLVRSLVAMHGGTVTAHSDGEGKGSEFVVRLPLTTKRPETDIAPPTDRARVRALREGARIVVVEDNADSRELLCELLAQEGFECATAESGPAGLALIDRIRPAIAILDVGLPEMDGFELARRLRSNGARRHVPDSAHRLRSGERPGRGREAGFDEHLVKPVNIEGLLSLLADLRSGVVRDAAGAEGGVSDMGTVT